MTKNKLIIFDCDGVLVDSEILLTGQFTKHLEEAGYPLTIENSIKRFTGKSAKTIYQEINDEQIIHLSPAQIEKIQSKIHEVLHAEVTAIPGVPHLLQKSRQDHSICVASSGTMEKIRKSLSRANLRDYFDNQHLFSAQSVTHGKPAPDLFLYAANQMGFSPQDCIVVEDSPAGIEAALAASMPVIAFLAGSHTHYEWYQQKILSYGVPVAHTCEELIKYLDLWNKDELSFFTPAPVKI